MDLDFSKKVLLIQFLEKLIKFTEPDFAVGALCWNEHTGQTQIYLGHGHWTRVV